MAFEDINAIKLPKVKNGHYETGISNNVYHLLKTHYSSSQFKHAVDSHASFRWYLENGHVGSTEWKAGSAMDFGSLVHTLLLEPHLVEKEFAFMDVLGQNFRTKAGKEYKAQFLAKNKDKIVLQAHDLDRAKMCVDAVKEHSFAMKLLEAKGEPEVSGFFEYEGLEQRIRPDRLVSDLDGRTVIVDIKTTDDIEKFERKAKWELDYDLSAYMYQLGHSIITGEMVDFFFLVVESSAPHRVAVYRASDKFLETGKRKYEKALANIKTALKVPSKPVVFQDCMFEEI